MIDLKDTDIKTGENFDSSLFYLGTNNSVQLQHTWDFEITYHIHPPLRLTTMAYEIPSSADYKAMVNFNIKRTYALAQTHIVFAPDAIYVLYLDEVYVNYVLKRTFKDLLDNIEKIVDEIYKKDNKMARAYDIRNPNIRLLYECFDEIYNRTGVRTFRYSKTENPVSTSEDKPLFQRIVEDQWPDELKLHIFPLEPDKFRPARIAKTQYGNVEMFLRE